MAKRPTLSDITTGHGTTTKLNANFDAIEQAFDNTLSRDGSSPNAMEAALDMNSNQILNLPDATTDKEPLTYGQYIAGGASAVVNGFRKETQTATAAQTVFTATSVEWVPGIDNLIVFVNGELQGPGLYTVDSSTQITFTSGLTLADRVDFVVMQIATTQINTTIDAGLVSYNPANTSNVTNVETKLRESVSVKDFGAVGDGVTDDTLAIKAAIDSLTPFGGNVYFPQGIYLVSELQTGGVPQGCCVKVEYPIRLIGENSIYTAIRPADSVAATVNTINFSPNTGYAHDYSGVESLFLGNPNNGTRAGKHGVFADTQAAGQQLPGFFLRYLNVGLSAVSGALAFLHVNIPANNANGGLYNARIENSSLRGGIELQGSGDSIQITKNIISANNIGIDSNQVAGASLLSIVDNNITSFGGSIRINQGLRVHIERNNIEHYSANSSGNDNAMINFNCGSGAGVGGVIQKNLVSAFGSTDATKLVRLKECNGMLVKDNVFLAGVGGITAIDVTTNSANVRLGSNTYNAAIATKIADIGNGTMGFQKDINSTLQNSWVKNSASEDVKVYKDLSGIVTLEGACKNGTATPGTTILTLPVGFRPATTVRFAVYSTGGSVAGVGRVDITSGGVVTIEDGGNTLLSLNGVRFLASDAANSVSFE